MSTISIQFYALPEELIGIIEKWKKEFDFHLVVMTLFPETATFEINSFEDGKRLPIKLEDIFSVFLGLKTPLLDVKNKYNFIEKNPDFVFLDLGKLGAKGLEESWFAGKTDNVELLAVWKKLARQLKKITKAGLWATNIDLSGKVFYRDFRYTTSACKLSQDGVKLLSQGSFIYFSVDEPQS